MERKEMPQLCFEQKDIQGKLHCELIDLSQRPVGKDPVVRSFAEGLHGVLHESSPAAEAITTAVASRIENKRLPYDAQKREKVVKEQASYSARLIFNALQHHYWGPKKHDPEYPKAARFKSAEHWHDQITSLFDEASPYRDQLAYDISDRELMSNVAQRYITIKMLTTLEGQRWDNAPRILDIGGSLMIGPKKLLAEGKAGRFTPPWIMKNVRNERGVYTTVDDELTGKMTRIALGAYAVRDEVVHYGVDKFVTSDHETIQRARSNSFYAIEIEKKPHLVETFDDLLKQGDELLSNGKIHIQQADFTEDNIQVFDGEKFDIIFISTMLYQMVPDDRKTVYRNARKLLSDNGMLVIQDGAFLDKNDPEWLDFSAEEFHKYFKCKTYVLDKAMEDRGFQELIRWRNMRCNEATIGNSRLALELAEKLRQLP